MCELNGVSCMQAATSLLQSLQQEQIDLLGGGALLTVQGLLLAGGLRRPCGVRGMEAKLVACKAGALPAVLTLAQKQQVIDIKYPLRAQVFFTVLLVSEPPQSVLRGPAVAPH